jgi:hypothetical protein
MKDRPETSVNSPHVTRELLATWVISIGAMLAGAWLLVTRPFPDDAWIGGLVVNLMGVALGVGLTTLILNAQICVRYRDGKFLISRWLTHLRARTPEQTVSVSSVREVRIAWPLGISLVGSEGSTPFNTFWWRPHRYRELEQLAKRLGLS